LPDSKRLLASVRQLPYGLLDDLTSMILMWILAFTDADMATPKLFVDV